MTQEYNSKFSRPGPIRAGFEYQDAHALSMMVSWLCNPYSIQWMKIEADQYKWVDDIVVCCCDGSLELYQVKYSTHPDYPVKALSFSTMTRIPGGKKSPRKKTSLLQKLFKSWQGVCSLENPVTLILKTNLKPTMEFKSLLQFSIAKGGFLDLKKFKKCNFFAVIQTHLNCDENHLLDFFKHLRFDLEELDCDIILDATKRTFENTLGGSVEDLFRLVESIHHWSMQKNIPSVSGEILMEHVKSAVGFIPYLREDFLKLCRDEVRREIKDFIGNSFSRVLYVKREFDSRLGKLLDPWKSFSLSINNLSTLSFIDELFDLMREAAREKDFDGLKAYLLILENLLEKQLFTLTLQMLEKIKLFIHKLNEAIKGRQVEEMKKCFLFFYDFRFDFIGPEIGKDAKDKLESFYKKAFLEKDFNILIQANQVYEFHYRRVEEQKAKLSSNQAINIEELQIDFSIVKKFTDIKKSADEVLDSRSLQFIVLAAEGGKGKTWMLCHAALDADEDAPVLFLSAKDSRILQPDGIIHCLAAIFSSLRPPSHGFSPRRIPALLSTCLKADETIAIIIDGIDWRADPRTIGDHLVQLRAQIQHLPMRIILSVRREYWSRICWAFDDHQNYNLISTEITDFSNEEMKDVEALARQFNINIGSVEPHLFKNPMIFGLNLQLALKMDKETQSKPLKTLDIFSLYLDWVVENVVHRLRARQWNCQLMVKEMFRCVLQNAGHNTGKVDFSKIKRGRLKQNMEALDAEFNHLAVDEFISCGLLQGIYDDVWFSSDLILEYGLGKLIVEEYWDAETNNLKADFFKTFDMRREWLPGQIGVMAVVAVLFAEKGIRLWETLPYEFDGLADWFNQILNYLPPAYITPRFLRLQFSLNADQLSQLKAIALGLKPYRYLNTERRTDVLPQMKYLQIKREVNALIAKLEEPSLMPLTHSDRKKLFRCFDNSDLLLDRTGNQFQKDYSFWLKDFAGKVVPLLSHPDTTMETRYFLVNCISNICLSHYVPVELIGIIYMAYINQCAKLNVTLPENQRMKILTSDDDEIILEFVDIFLKRGFDYNSNPGLVEFSSVENGDGILTLEKILNERYSVLLIDIDKPGLDGLQVIERYREKVPKDPLLPIIIMTGYGHMDDYSRDVGADGIIHKPIRCGDLESVTFGFGAKDRVHIHALRNYFIKNIHSFEPTKKVLEREETTKKIPGETETTKKAPGKIGTTKRPL